MLKTLYVRRPLKNRDDLAAWAKAQGLELQDGAHVTIAFSKNPLKWPKESANPFFIPDAREQKDGARSVDMLGEGAIVLRFESTLLQERFAQLRALGATWDFDEYQPHVTICYDPDGEIDIGDVQPYLGPLVFGPEVFAEVKLKAPALEVAMDEAFDALMAEIQAQTAPVLAFDRAPEGLLDRHGVVAELAFDRDLNEGRTTDGFERMHVKRAPITKAGVNPYYGREIPKGKELGLLPDKVYKLLRHPDEIKKGAATSHNVPLLSDHVPHSADDHDGDIIAGTVGSNAEYEHPVLYNSLALWARNDIDGVESKQKRELSSAYGYDADMTPGEYEGEPYDGVMRNMKWNHVAMVKKGRAGSDIALDEELQPPNQETTKMKLKSLKATVAYGALTTYLRPKLAMDAAMPNIGAALGTFEPGKFKESIPNFVAALKKSLAKIKLAQDSDLAGVVEGVQQLMASIDGDKVVKDEKLDRDPNEQDQDKDPDGDDVSMDDDMSAIKAYLAEKGVPEDIIAGMPGGEKKEPVDPAMTADDEFPAKKDGEEDDDDKKKPKPFDKGAMDAAIKKAQDDTIKRMNSINDAREKVRPVVGALTMAFDSAEGVYRHALKMQGQDVSKIKELSALEHMWTMIPAPGAKREPIAQDSSAATDYNSRFPHAAKVKRG